jgi:hypothetical protein
VEYAVAARATSPALSVAAFFVGGFDIARHLFIRASAAMAA